MAKKKPVPPKKAQARKPVKPLAKKKPQVKPQIPPGMMPGLGGMPPR